MKDRDGKQEIKLNVLMPPERKIVAVTEGRGWPYILLW
jgi:hypothetical protein